MEKVNLNKILKDLEIDYIKKALLFTNNNTTHAAELLGLQRTTLIEKLKALDMSIPRPKRYVVKEKNGIANAFLIRHANNMEDELYGE